MLGDSGPPVPWMAGGEAVEPEIGKMWSVMLSDWKWIGPGVQYSQGSETGSWGSGPEKQCHPVAAEQGLEWGLLSFIGACVLHSHYPCTNACTSFFFYKAGFMMLTHWLFDNQGTKM